MKSYIYKAFYTLMFIEGLIFSSDIYSRKTLTGGFLKLGFSTMELVLLFMGVLIVLSAGALRLNKEFHVKVKMKTTAILEHDRWWVLLMVLISLFAYEAFQDILFINSDIDPIHYQGYRNFLGKNISLLVWLFFGSFQVMVIGIIYRWETIRSWIKPILKQRFIYLFILTAAIIFSISISGIGDTLSSAQNRNIHQLNVPIVGIQVILISTIVLILFIFMKWLGTKWDGGAFLKRDAVILIVLGIFAFVLWSNIPLGESTFTDALRPPNFDFYPTSDALHYDQGAHQIMVGNGLKSYSHVGFQSYLALLHQIAGDGYRDILPLQLAIFSLVPMLLYQIARMLHTRLSGVVVSILFIIRTRSSLLLGEHLTLSSVADLMTESLGILGVILISAFLIMWFHDPDKRKFMPLLAGAAIGWTILIRVEILAMIPAIVLIVIVFFRKNSRMWLQGISIMILGIIFVAGPWMAYQYKLTGSPMAFLLGKGTYLKRAVGQYEIDPPDLLETKEEELSNLFPYLVVNNLLQQIYILPSNHQPLLTLASLPDLVSKEAKLADLEGDSFSEKYLERYIKSLPYWWQGEWNGRLVPRSYFPVLGSVLLIFIGIKQIKERKAWLAALLGLMLLSHAVIYAFIGQSGGRSMQIVDWIPMVFYGIGISYILNLIFKQTYKEGMDTWWYEVQSVSPLQDNPLLQFKPKFIYVSILLLILGVSYPLADTVIPAKYDQETLEENLHQISLLNGQDSKFEGETRTENPDMVILYGKMVFPRYFGTGERMLDHRRATIPDFSYSRIEFYLLGTENIWVALPSHRGEEPLGHAMDVIVIGTRENSVFNEDGVQISGEYIRAKDIYILPVELTTEPIDVISCISSDCKN